MAHDILGLGELKALNDEQSSNMIHKLQQNVICPICQEIMFCPCVTSCGHTYCYNCLYEWFKSRNRSKTCPNCRERQIFRPAVSVQLRDIVGVIVSAVLLANPDKRKEIDGIRAKAMKEYEEDMDTYNESFPMLFENDRPRVVDVEDGVSRCPFCSWELNGNFCAHCMRYYSDIEDEGDDAEEEEDEDSANGEPDEYEDDGFVVDDSMFDNEGDYSEGGTFHEDEDDEDERRQYSGSDAEVDFGSNGGDEDNGVEHNSDSSLDDDSEIRVIEGPSEPQVNRTSRRRIIASDSEDDSNSDVEEISGTRNTATTTTTRSSNATTVRTINITDDLDSDEDDHHRGISEEVDQYGHSNSEADSGDYNDREFAGSDVEMEMVVDDHEFGGDGNGEEDEDGYSSSFSGFSR